MGTTLLLRKRKGITYRNVITNKLIVTIIFSSRSDFLIEDIYLMHKLKLRPEKKEKDRQRLVRLSKMVTTTVSTNDAIDDIFSKSETQDRYSNQAAICVKNVPMSKASRIDPYKYNNLPPLHRGTFIETTCPRVKTLVLKDTKVEGLSNTSGNNAST